ncbi:hypothetical protein FA15DRAFT_51260 [Coprinopsis marcescibilis]|uniref:Uncharacterized protein n=1 Tax=Coprinopsis marcescibilis TaxID=230819 RepID=A0A5C3KNQ9_COPMA|nr:hypothetical protein FA15DRAFT_51260 [Coprinopsis marcescibilis]
MSAKHTPSSNHDLGNQPSMQTPPQTPKPILKRLFFRLNATFRRKNDRSAIGTLISRSTQIGCLLADPRAIEGESGPTGVSFGRKVLQAATNVADIGASIADAIPGGTPVKGALDAVCKVLKVVELNLQNKEDVEELRSKIDELVDLLSESTIPVGDATYGAGYGYRLLAKPMWIYSTRLPTQATIESRVSLNQPAARMDRTAVDAQQCTRTMPPRKLTKPSLLVTADVSSSSQCPPTRRKLVIGPGNPSSARHGLLSPRCSTKQGGRSLFAREVIAPSSGNLGAYVVVTSGR